MTVRHIVMFKFKPHTPPATILNFIKEGNELPNLMTNLKFSISIRPSFTTDRSKGFTHVLYSEFCNKEDIMEYSNHATHVEFVSQYKPHFEDVMAVDMED
eukprot:GHVT01033065.1.p1 GENE.GHVT01033065.1~~GHVT01033065.1.p1  ORF type:complete len:100 (-),score=4.96 GHVT01033065.1:399-698(-)